MKLILRVFGLFLIVLLSGCFWASPGNIGLENGRLKQCPPSPNCVSSFESGDHYIRPLEYKGDFRSARDRLLESLKNNYSASVKTQSDTYVYVTVTTTLGFVDDLEFLVEPNREVIQVRSASRVGHSDLGKNRERIEFLRKQFHDRN